MSRFNGKIAPALLSSSEAGVSLSLACDQLLVVKELGDQLLVVKQHVITVRNRFLSDPLQSAALERAASL